MQMPWEQSQKTGAVSRGKAFQFGPTTKSEDKAKNENVIDEWHHSSNSFAIFALWSDDHLKAKKWPGDEFTNLLIPAPHSNFPFFISTAIYVHKNLVFSYYAIPPLFFHKYFCFLSNFIRWTRIGIISSIHRHLCGEVHELLCMWKVKMIFDHRIN